MSNYLQAAVRKEMETNDVPFRMVCPSCMGGSDHEHCLSVYEITNAKGFPAVLATCHRANCEVETFGVTDGAWASPRPTPRNLSPILHEKLWEEESHKIDYHTRIVSPGGIQINPVLVSQYMRGHDEGFLFAMRDPNWGLRGCVLRRVRPQPGQSKAHTYKEQGYSGMSWYEGVTTAGEPHIPTGWKHDVSPLYVVEDPMSALVLASFGADAVSLNGTALGEKRAYSLGSYHDDMILSLDADATSLAIRYATRYAGLLNIQVRRLTKDIKDMNEDEVLQYLQGG